MKRREILTLGALACAVPAAIAVVSSEDAIEKHANSLTSELSRRYGGTWGAFISPQTGVVSVSRLSLDDTR